MTQSSAGGQTSWLRWRPSRVSPTWRAQGTIYRGWVKVKNGDVAEGISLLRGGSAAYRATGAEALMPYHIALLARACEIAGQIEEAVDPVGRRVADRRKDRGALVAWRS